MAYDRFLIAPFDEGLITSERPWLIPDQAFAELTNAYVFRGRVKKRFGSHFMGISQFTSRLRINLGNTAAVTGNFTNGGLALPGSYWNIGSMFTVGSTIFTVYQANGAMLTTGTATGTFNTATGMINITGNNENPATPVFYYPALPVMGITTYDQINTSINNQPPVAFDMQYAYSYSGGWFRLVSITGGVTTPIWHGTNLNYFWAANWHGVTVDTALLFVSNFFYHVPLGLLTDDPIWYYNGTDWAPFSYSPDALLNPTNVQPLTVTTTTPADNKIIANYVQTAKIIVAFKNRLILLNTVENNANGATAFNPGLPLASGITPANYVTSTNKNFSARARFSHNGSPLATNAWLEPNQTYNPGATGVVIADGGGYIDATTDEAIVSAEFIKDRLIVFFERSTWELAYTGNELQPFVWQKINTELGVEGTFSIVPFDKQILGVGNSGVLACNGANVERIDLKIPQQVFELQNANNIVQRIAGIRDYKFELVYWSYVGIDAYPGNIYPNEILVYNYRNNTWAINEDCFTTWGYWEQQADLTWATAIETWEEANFNWIDNIQEAQARQIIGGNQEGFVLIVDGNDSSNAPSMQITNMTYNIATATVTLTIIDHTLEPVDNDNTGDYIQIQNDPLITGVTFGNADIPLTSIYKVNSVVDKDTITIAQVTSFAGTYKGGATVSRVSNISILSKQWNPYDKQGRNIYLAKIDFAIQKTANGQVTVDYYPSSTELSLIDQGGPTGTNTNVGTNVLETSPYLGNEIEKVQPRLWHPIYFNGEGECVQIFMSMSFTQMINPAIALSDFELEGLVLYTMPTSQRLQ